MSYIRCFVVAGLVLSARSGLAQDGTGVLAAIEEQSISVIERVEPSIVSIVRGKAAPDRLAADRINPFGDLPGRLRGRWGDLPHFPSPSDADFVPQQFGAGVVVANEAGERYILTNHHVVQGAQAAGEAAPRDGTSQVYVRFHDRRGYYATIHASDPRSDLAVLRIDYDALGIEPPKGRDSFPRAIELSDAKDYRKGTLVFVFGNPYGIARDGSSSVGWGMIGNVFRRPAPVGSPLDRTVRAEETVHHYGTLLQLDCRVDLGFSGGATVDRNGRLIGLTTALAALEGYESTAGFAIPIDGGIRRVIGDLLHGHEAEYGFLGVQPADRTAAQIRLILPDVESFGGAVQAESVKAGSPADRAGLQSGDIILSIDGRRTVTTPDLMRQIGLAGPGSEVTLETLRVGSRRQAERRTVRVRLDKWPVINEKELVASVPRFKPWNGLRIDYATARQRFLSPSLEPYPRGVVVLEAAATGNDAESLQAGDFITAVNGNPVDTPEQFYAAVGDAESATLQLSDGRRITLP